MDRKEVITLGLRTTEKKCALFRGLLTVVLLTTFFGIPAFLYSILLAGSSPLPTAVFILVSYSVATFVMWTLVVGLYKFRNDITVCERAIGSLRILEMRDDPDPGAFAAKCEVILQEAVTGVLEPVSFRIRLPVLPRMPFTDVLLALLQNQKENGQEEASDEHGAGAEREEKTETPED